MIPVNYTTMRPSLTISIPKGETKQFQRACEAAISATPIAITPASIRPLSEGNGLAVPTVTVPTSIWTRTMWNNPLSAVARISPIGNHQIVSRSILARPRK